MVIKDADTKTQSDNVSIFLLFGDEFPLRKLRFNVIE